MIVRPPLRPAALGSFAAPVRAEASGIIGLPSTRSEAMPTRNMEHRDDDDAARLKALRAALGAGTADTDAGRYVTFESADALRRHLKTVAKEAIRATVRARRR